MSVQNRFAILAVLAFAAACTPKPSTAGADSQQATPPTTAAPTTTAAADLKDTYWLLTTLRDKSIAASDTQRAAHIILRGDSKQVNGSGGCNRMFGVYELNGDALRFSGIGATKMACQDGMDTEVDFLSALLNVAKWKIDGQQLSLSDSTGAVIATFDAKAKR